MLCFRAITKNRYTRSGFSEKQVHSETKKKTPHDPSRCWLVKSIPYPSISPFLGDNDPQIHLQAANYILRLVQVQFRWLKPALGGIRVRKARKSFVVATVFFTCARRVPVLCPTWYAMNRERVQQSCYVHGLYVWYVDVLAEVRIMVEQWNESRTSEKVKGQK